MIPKALTTNSYGMLLDGPTILFEARRGKADHEIAVEICRRYNLEPELKALLADALGYIKSEFQGHNGGDQTGGLIARIEAASSHDHLLHSLPLAGPPARPQIEQDMRSDFLTFPDMRAMEEETKTALAQLKHHQAQVREADTALQRKHSEARALDSALAAVKSQLRELRDRIPL